MQQREEAWHRYDGELKSLKMSSSDGHHMVPSEAAMSCRSLEQCDTGCRGCEGTGKAGLCHSLPLARPREGGAKGSCCGVCAKTQPVRLTESHRASLYSSALQSSTVEAVERSAAEMSKAAQAAGSELISHPELVHALSQ